MALLAASGGDTMKLFDVSVDSGDPCSLSYTPSPSHQVNSVKWNHTMPETTRRLRQSLGTMPISFTDSGDNIECACRSGRGAQSLDNLSLTYCQKHQNTVNLTVDNICGKPGSQGLVPPLASYTRSQGRLWGVHDDKHDMYSESSTMAKCNHSGSNRDGKNVGLNLTGRGMRTWLVNGTTRPANGTAMLTTKSNGGEMYARKSHTPYLK